MTRFSKFYITVFASIWLGYGVYSLLLNRPNSVVVFFFGLGFSVVFIATVWFSEWLMKNYKRIDQLGKEALRKK